MLDSISKLEHMRRGYRRKSAGKLACAGGGVFGLGWVLVGITVLFPPAGILAAPVGFALIALGTLGVLTAVLATPGEILF
jgi:hypothetical protein